MSQMMLIELGVVLILSKAVTCFLEKPVSTTHSPDQHGQGQQDHCYQYNSYRELASLVNHSQCLSANTVWHLLDDLQKHNSSCRTHIQNLLSHLYNNIPTDGNNECVCTPKHTLTNKQHLHYTNTNYDDRRYLGCSHEAGSTYSVIERDLFTHITDHGCRNHNYLWPTLAGVKNNYSNYSDVWRDCTQDLITRAALDYPYQASDKCTCVHNENGWESWSPWTCKIMKSDLLATCHNYRQRHCLSNMATDCEGSSFETMDCHEPQCSDAEITHVNCSVYNRSSTCEDQASCIYFSNKPWQICDNAAHVAQCPRLCTCCQTTTTTTSTTHQTTTPTSTTTTTKSDVMTASHVTAGQWSEWFNGKCSATCGFGTQHRLRSCSTGQNADCAGSSTDLIPCNEQNCIQPVPLPECNHTCTLYAAGIGIAVFSVYSSGCARPSEFASDEALLITCCSLGLRHGWRKGKPVQQTGVCIKGEIPYYTPVSLYNGQAITNNHAGIFVGCIDDGQSGFKMISQDCNTLPTVLFVNGTDVTDPNNYFAIF